MEISEAKNSLKKVTRDASSLNPTAIISLFEIDITDLLKNNERTLFLEEADQALTQQTVKPFYDFITTLNYLSSIRYNGKVYFAQSNYWIRSKRKGSPPRPKMSISIDPEVYLKKHKIELFLSKLR